VRERLDEPTEDRNPLGEFFAVRDEPSSQKSTFTPAEVAEIIRRDRDASE